MNYFIYFNLIFFTIVQDMKLSYFIGHIGNTVMPIIVILSLMYIIIRYKKIVVNKVSKILIFLLGYLLLIDILILVFEILIMNGNPIILGENALLKTIKGAIYFVFIVGYVICLENLLPKLNRNQIFKPIVFTFISLIIILVFEKSNPQVFNRLFHYGTEYNRVRLLTSESSYTGTIIMVFSLLTLFYFREKRTLYKYICWCGIVIFIISTNSKGLILSILLTLIIYILFSRTKISQKLLIISLLLVVSMTILPETIKVLNYDIRETTSVATRVYTTIVSIICMLKYPFGVGNFLYLKIFQRELSDNIGLMLSSSLNLSEIYMYIDRQTATAIGAKSGLFQYGLYWGIIGTLIFIIYMWKIIKLTKYNTKYSILYFLSIFLIMSILFYINFDIKYEIWMAFTLIIFLTTNQDIGGYDSHGEKG